jgi:hypothetical protein
MNYTDKYLIKDISNKAFNRKYGAKSNTRANPVNETWKQRILRKNPWLMEDLFKEREPEPQLFSEDQAHLDSIRAEA